MQRKRLEEALVAGKLMSLGKINYKINLMLFVFKIKTRQEISLIF
jgi:hypothetical protein